MLQPDGYYTGAVDIWIVEYSNTKLERSHIHIFGDLSSNMMAWFWVLALTVVQSSDTSDRRRPFLFVSSMKNQSEYVVWYSDLYSYWRIHIQSCSYTVIFTVNHIHIFTYSYILLSLSHIHGFTFSRIHSQSYSYWDMSCRRHFPTSWNCVAPWLVSSPSRVVRRRWMLPRVWFSSQRWLPVHLDSGVLIQVPDVTLSADRR